MTTKVNIIECERGWGCKIDEVKVFPTIREANDFVDEFNSKNNLDKVPDWYMFAEVI